MSPPDQSTHEGSCFCGAVQIAAYGSPFAMGYCHCKDCRHWSAGPVNAFTLWKCAEVKVTQGAEFLDSHNQTEGSTRKFCKKCGGHVLSDHAAADFTDVFAAILPTLTFKPALHVNYESTVLRVRDGLPKLKDFPSEMGGSGEMLPE